MQKRLNTLVFLCILIQTFRGNWLSLFRAYYLTFPVAETTWSPETLEALGSSPLTQLHSHHSSLSYNLLNNMTQLLYSINGYNDTPIYPQVEPTRICVNKHSEKLGKVTTGDSYFSWKSHRGTLRHWQSKGPYFCDRLSLTMSKLLTNTVFPTDPQTKWPEADHTTKAISPYQ